jgi:putative transposase
MARPLRLEFAGALYHVTSRGDGREAIFRGDGDRLVFFEVLAGMWERFNWVIHAYCLMTNHYHLLVETPDGNLATGMREPNGVYTQRFNRIHRRVGHVFQGRYKAILVQKETYLLELARYVVLNPVRARMVASAGDYRWSSYRAMIRNAAPPDWLETGAILNLFGQTEGQAVGGEKGPGSNGANLSRLILWDMHLAAYGQLTSASSDGRSAAPPRVPRSEAWSSGETCCFVACAGAARYAPV